MLIGQPPVSPERNPAERVFAEVRRHSDGEVSATLSEMDAAAHAFRKELDADPARVRRIAGWQ